MLVLTAVVLIALGTWGPLSEVRWARTALPVAGLVLYGWDAGSSGSASWGALVAFMAWALGFVDGRESGWSAARRWQLARGVGGDGLVPEDRPR